MSETNTEDAETGAEKTLERRYRRFLMLLPGSYRQARGEELLSTLMDAAEPGRTWPSAGETASLLLLALRGWTRTTDAEGRLTSSGSALRIAALSGTLYFAAGGVEAAYLWLRSPGRQMDPLSYGGLATDQERAAMFVSFSLLPLAWLLVFAALVLGFRRTATVSGLLTVVADHVCVTWAPGKNLATVATLTVVAIVLATRRSAPPVRHRSWWLVGLLVVGGIQIYMQPGWYAGQDTERTFLLALADIALFATVTVRRSPMWPIALAVVGLPFLVFERLDLRAVWEGTSFLFNQQNNPTVLPAAQIEALLIIASAYSLLRAFITVVFRRLRGPAARAGLTDSVPEDPFGAAGVVEDF